MKVIVLPKEEAIEKIAEKIVSVVRQKPNAVISLPTGGTQLEIYKKLVEFFEQNKADFSQTIFFNLDEYVGLQQSHNQSYAHYLQENFLSKINAKKENILLFDGAAGKFLKQAKEREAFLKEKGIDLAYIGIGENAHIAFNEPGSSFSSKTRVVKLSASTIAANSRFFSSKKDVPKKAISVGLNTILKAKRIVLVSFGEKKALAIKKTVEEKPSKLVPASILQKHSDIEIYCDKESASLLKQTKRATE